MVFSEKARHSFFVYMKISVHKFLLTTLDTHPQEVL